MVTGLSYEEALKDSPKFHNDVQKAEKEIHDLEVHTEKIIKACSSLIDSGKTYNLAQNNFVKVIGHVVQGSSEDVFVKSTLLKICETIAEISSHHKILMDQTNRTVKHELNQFMKLDVKGASDLKKTFDKSSEEFQSSLHKHIVPNKTKNENDDVTHDITHHHNAFRKVSMDYVYQLKLLQHKKRLQATERLFTYMQAIQVFYQQGFNLMKELEPFLRGVNKELDRLSHEAKAKNRELFEQKEKYKAMKGHIGIYTNTLDDETITEGYLFKRTKNAFKTWNRRWFTIRNHRLFYQKKNEGELTVAIDDVRLCTTKLTDDSDRKNCFEIISVDKSFTLQAENDHVRDLWMDAIRNSIGAAFKSNINEEKSPQLKRKESLSNKAPERPSSPLSNQCEASTTSASMIKPIENISFLEGNGNADIITQIYRVPGNKQCADCGRSDPRWASFSLGIVLCIDCSGIHRSMGVHISKVRSLTLDQWEPEIIQVMTKLGNERVNEIYLSSCHGNQPTISPTCTNEQRREFIRYKYKERKYVISLTSLVEKHNRSLKAAGSVGSGGKVATKWVVSNRSYLKKQLKELVVQQQQQQREEQEFLKAPVDNSRRKSLFEGDELNSLFSYFDGRGLDAGDSDVVVFGQPIKLENKCRDYEEREVCDINRLDANLLFSKAATAGNIPIMLFAKANGADINWKDSFEEGKTPLMKATAAGNLVTCEYLLVNGSKANMMDDCGRTALHYAVINSHTGLVCQLIKKKVDLEIIDKNGKSPLQLAVDGADADVVTLIRLKKLNNEMKEDSMTSQNDEIVNEVFRDFSQRSTANLQMTSQRDSFDHDKCRILGGAAIAVLNLTSLTGSSPPAADRESSV